ncbi:MAG: hypothetical protein M3P98_03240 [bacterium]|nr:hypothetical protein [bacterium]
MDISRTPKVIKKEDRTTIGKIMRASWMVLLFSSTLLIVSVTFSLVIRRDQRREPIFIDRNAYQAIFIQGQQLPYFGKIAEVNAGYMVLDNIYYLSVGQSLDPDTKAQPQVIKLGCELHGPQDRMVINREQISWWQNLRNDGKVSEAIEQYTALNGDKDIDCTAAQADTPQ